MKKIVVMETYLKLPVVAKNLFHVIIHTREQNPAATVCISVMSMRAIAMTTTTVTATFNVELKIVIGHHRLIVAPTHLMQEVNSLDFTFRYSNN